MEESNLLNQLGDTAVDHKKQDNNVRYLLQINRIKLKNYINHALILPDTYLNDECEKDIQSKNKDFLVFSSGNIRELDESQILIDVILTDSEKEKLHQFGEVYYADFPLPISRIKKIYVYDKQILKHLLATIETSENGTLPNTLFDIYKKGKRNLFEKREYQAIDEQIQPNSYKDSINTFDKRMGMFSFMKNTNLYYADKTNEISIYSDSYFSFQKLLEGSEYQELKTLTNHHDFKEVLYSENQIDKSFLVSFSESIEELEIKKLFDEYLKPTGVRSTIKEFANQNQDIYYLIGLIWYFRQRTDSNKLDNLKSDIQDLIPYDKAELSLAILGLYYGYSRLRSHEEIVFNDKVFKNIFDSRFNIKFEMNSKLDYVTVESLYQLCFNKQNNNKFDFTYLEYPTYKYSINTIKDKKLAKWYRIDKNEKHFDVINIKVKKLSVLEMFGNLLGKYSDKIMENKQSGYLITFVQYNFSDLLRVNEKGQKYFSKDDLLQKLVNTDIKVQNTLYDVLNIGNS